MGAPEIEAQAEAGAEGGIRPEVEIRPGENAVSARLREARRWLGLDIETAALVSGVPAKRLRAIDRADAPPRRSDLRDLARAYRHPPEYFTTGAMPPDAVPANVREALASDQAAKLTARDREEIARFGVFLQRAGAAPTTPMALAFADAAKRGGLADARRRVAQGARR